MNQHLSRNSLSGAIAESLRRREMLPDLALKLLEDDGRKVRFKNETEYWDYKECIDLSNPLEAAQLAKDILGFHNTKGGAVIIGVTDSYLAKGFPEAHILDTVRLNGKLRKYISSNVPLFQDQIELKHTGNPLWLIFVPQKQGAPIAVAANGPEKKGVPVIKKGTYYVRVDDEVRPCIDPADYAILFSGQNVKNLHAYQYDIDEPFFRLLAPHCERFFGRKQLLSEVHRSLGLRHPVVCLDGVGGVGKSAVAIELIQHLYEAKEYDFIISLSAKNRIWHGYSGARQAAFTGITELLQEIAVVLGINIYPSPDELKASIVSFMSGLKGLLLIDNLEEIQDASVFRFLSEEVPAPVKVLVTTRVDRSLGAKTISIPAMQHDEATDLLCFELERNGVLGFLKEQEALEQILKATGRVPLAIKWAASLARTDDSLTSVSRRVRSFDTTKREFLDFCFSTMYDALSANARDTAMLCPYLGDEWNNLTVSIALNKPVTEIDEAIKELEDKGLILASMPGKHETYSVLPLTMDFLSSKWHESESLRKEVGKRIADSLVSGDGQDIFGLSIDERATIIMEKACALERDGELDGALKLLRLGLQWVKHDCGNQRIGRRLSFAEGRVLFQKSGTKRSGITLMRKSLCPEGDVSEELANDKLFLAEALLDYGNRNEEKEAIELVADAIGRASTVTRALIRKFCALAVGREDSDAMARFLAGVRDDQQAVWVAEEIWEHVNNRQIAYQWGHKSVAWILGSAGKSVEVDKEVRKEYLRLSAELSRVGKSV